MADIVVTASAVVKGSEASVSRGVAGETITAGQPLYIDSTDGNRLKKADANASDATAAAVGIALHGADDEQPIEYIVGGNLTFNAVLTVGKAYVVSANAGGIAPIADLATGWRTTLLGIATSTTNLKMGLLVSGATNA